MDGDLSNVLGPHTTLADLADLLGAGKVSARDLVETALGRIEDPVGEGSRAFVSVAAERARAEADGIDRARAAGGRVGPYGGIPIAVKDLADVAGEVTTAGSVVLADGQPAVHDAPAVGRLRAAGFVVVGRTNMTEFAYSGLGLNVHYGTPRSPWDRSSGGRIPGGSSSGTAVAVSDAMVPAGLGTDTGGSCRIPAAFGNIVGFKPTARRVPLDGIVPLSPSMDSVGPLAPSVDCCARLDAVMAGAVTEPTTVQPDDRLETLRLGVVRDLFLDGADDIVIERFESAVATLASSGVTVQDVAFPELGELADINRGGGLAAAEAYHWHRELLARDGARYDQRVRVRIEAGAALTAADYLEIQRQRRRFVGLFDDRCRGFDALIVPTVAMVAPTVASFDDGDMDHYGSRNLLALRNTSVGNFVDACAISLPLCRPEQRSEVPGIGLMLMSPAMHDRRLLNTAATLERPLHQIAGITP